MSEADYAALITAAHRYLDAPVIMIWDNLNTHLSRKMRAFTAGHPDWLTVIQLPAYAPDLNPVEGAWSVMKNSLGNLAPGTTGQLAAAMRHQLDRIQRRPALITGFLGQTGLALEPEPLTPRPWHFKLCSSAGWRLRRWAGPGRAGRGS
jgi:hypothetical protein